MSSQHPDHPYPVLTHEELCELIQKLSLIFDVVRVVDAVSLFVVDMDRNGHCRMQSHHCHEIWHKNKRCENCISLLSYLKKTRLTKFEFIGEDVYHVTSQYILADQKPFTLEIVQKITGDVLRNSLDSPSLHQQLESYSALLYSDSLTGIHNRRYYDDQVADLRLDAIAMLDLDNFKKLNDTYGHIQGDSFLEDAAQELKAMVRSSDIVLRYGGDEFFLAFQNISRENLMEKLEKIRLRLHELGQRRFPDLELSASIGAVMGSAPVSKLLPYADSALYQAKSRKNHLFFHEDFIR